MSATTHKRPNNVPLWHANNAAFVTLQVKYLWPNIASIYGQYMSRPCLDGPRLFPPLFNYVPWKTLLCYSGHMWFSLWGNEFIHSTAYTWTAFWLRVYIVLCNSPRVNKLTTLSQVSHRCTTPHYRATNLWLPSWPCMGLWLVSLASFTASSLPSYHLVYPSGHMTSDPELAIIIYVIMLLRASSWLHITSLCSYHVLELLLFLFSSALVLYSL